MIADSSVGLCLKHPQSGACFMIVPLPAQPTHAQSVSKMGERLVVQYLKTCGISSGETGCRRHGHGHNGKQIPVFTRPSGHRSISLFIFPLAKEVAVLPLSPELSWFGCSELKALLLRVLSLGCGCCPWAAGVTSVSYSKGWRPSGMPLQADVRCCASSLPSSVWCQSI